MDLTYMVRGADRKDYGPVGLEQLNKWIQEGRLLRDQEVKRSDMDYWVPAQDFTELQSAFGIAATAPITPPTGGTGVHQPGVHVDAVAAGQLKSSASWFYWIAGLSLVNSISALSGSSWRFIFGLGVTRFIDALGAQLEGAGKGVVLVLDLAAAGIFVLFGVFAHKGRAWAFIVGMALFALDGLLMVIFQAWIGVVFHVVVLFLLFRGFQACRRLRN